MSEIELKQEIDELKNKITQLETKLRTYTNPERHKRYYEKNKELVKNKAKTYMEHIKETDPEKLKEWRKNAYQKRKERNKPLG